MRAADRAVAALVRVLFALVRLLGPDRAGALGAAVARRFGPLVKAHRIALDNIRHAFPELGPAEHRRIALEAWDNLGRTAAEYVHLERLWDFDPDRPAPGRIEIAPEDVARFMELREDGKPALFFAAHLANWEFAGHRRGPARPAFRRAVPHAEQRRGGARHRGAPRTHHRAG